MIIMEKVMMNPIQKCNRGYYVNKFYDCIKGHPYITFVHTFLFICLFQTFSSFYGVDVADTGYFLTGYDQVLEAPESVMQTMGFYLTNVLGGGILKLFPNIGFWGFRIIGVILLDFTFLMIFWMLRNEIPIIHILLGCLLIVLGQAKFPCFFCAGLLTCSLYAIFLLLLYRGLSNNNKVLIFISGIVAGLNIFIRIPNVLAIGIIFLVLLNRWFIHGDRKCDWYFTIVFTSGILVGCFFVFILICLLGHQQLMIDTIANLVKSGNSGADGHSWSVLLTTQLFLYSQAIIFLCLFYTIFSIDSKISRNKLLISSLFWGAASFAIIYHVYLSSSFNPIWAMCFSGCLIGLRKYSKIRFLSVLSLFMLLVEPLGSNSGYNQGCLPAILAAPVASAFIINRNNILYVLVACLALGLQYFKQGCYGDDGPICDKNSLLDIPELAYMRTTKEKAEVINSSLPKLRYLITPKDTLIVCDAFPLMNYLTHTRPVNGQPWPALNSSAFDLTTCKNPPKILIQKFEHISKPLRATRGVPTGNQMLDSYMREHKYGIVYENSFFILLFPYHK